MKLRLLVGVIFGLVIQPMLRAAEFEPWSYTDNHLFPSALISTATVDWFTDEEEAEQEEDEATVYGDANGWLAVVLSDLPKNATVKVEIKVDGFLKSSVWKGKIKEKEAHVFPTAAWDYEALRRVREQRPVNATFKVWVNGKALPTQIEVFTVRSLNDCPFYVYYDEEEEEFDDFSMVFAAYVNENHPWVDGILKDALKTGIVSSFTGYQMEDSDEVLRQVFAIWVTLQKRGIRYSDVSTTTPSGLVASQTVRFLDESIEAQQANCVDGTVLMASVLRKIGLKVYLAMVPGHCFLAFDMGTEDEDPIWGLETTMLRDSEVGDEGKGIRWPKGMRKSKHEAAYRVFAAAIGTANASLKENAETMESAEDPETQLISVDDAREMGIMPIASGRKSKAF